MDTEIDMKGYRPQFFNHRDRSVRRYIGIRVDNYKSDMDTPTLLRDLTAQKQ